jgi:5,10-methylenetetrahydromethanopterin reductase
VRVAIRIPPGAPLPEVLSAIERADAAGFDTIAIPESPTLFRDTFITLGLATARTKQATLASAVTSFVTHDPLLLASKARTLSELAPSRIRLGIGAGDNVSFLTGRPSTTTRQLRDGIDTVRRLLAGEKVPIRGVELSIQDPPAAPIPIYLAADGPRNLALAAEVADGVITWSGELERKAAQLGAAKAIHQRTRDLHHVITTTVCITDDIQRDCWYLKPYILRYAQRVGPDYLEEIGFAGPLPDDNMVLADGVDLGHPRDLKAAADFVSQWISDEFAVWYATNVVCFGTAEEVAVNLLDLARYGADEVQVTDGTSYTLPIRLINDMADQVIPKLHAAG